MILTIETT